MEHIYIITERVFVSSIFYNGVSYFRYEINAIQRQKSKEENCEAFNETVSVASSSNVTDLRIGVASFCKAFPWHFVTDRRLELVQLGKLIFNMII